jgi:hypothetical protein
MTKKPTIAIRASTAATSTIAPATAPNPTDDVNDDPDDDPDVEKTVLEPEPVLAHTVPVFVVISVPEQVTVASTAAMFMVPPSSAPGANAL